MMTTWRWTGLALCLATGALLGCIPSEAPPNETAGPVAPAPSPEAAPEPPAVEPTPSEAPRPPARPEGSPEFLDGEEPSLAMMFGEDNVLGASQVAVRPLADRKGFEVEGSYGLKGVVKPVNAERTRWRFEADLEFPTGGYHVHEPYVSSLSDMSVAMNGDESAMVPLMVITLPLDIPGDDALVSQALVQETVEYEFDAVPNVQFTITFSDGQI